MNIHYAQCWEDPGVLRTALKVSPDDDVLSVASGGDNSFALLLDNPRSVTAIDRNPAQLHLVELKMQAIRTFDYDDFVSFLGARPSTDREKMYRILRRALSENTRAYWDSNSDTIKTGVIHCGKFERYFSIFNTRVLPLIHSRNTVETFLSITGREEQEEFYRNHWDNRRWRALFRVFFSRFLLSSLGRGREVFAQVNNNHIAETLLARTRRGLTEISISDNYFVQYILSGRFLNLSNTHPYLSPTNYETIRGRLDRLQLKCCSLEQWLSDNNGIRSSRFNLSDVFEYMPRDEVARNLRLIQATSRRQSRIAFWSLFVPQVVPVELAEHIRPQTETEKELHQLDRTFFYERLHCWQVN